MADKKNIFRIKAKRISTFLKSIAQDTFRNVIHVSREAGGMSDSRTKRYEYSLYITKHSNLKRDFTSVYLRSSRIILLKADDIIKTSFILINSCMKI
jgi:hypothetical protein